MVKKLETSLTDSLLNTVLPVMEDFYTIQGEGKYSGQAAYFIRLGGCDVGCVWCDVKESWDADAHPQLTVGQIVERAERYPGRLAVITGGEPLMHSLDALTFALKEKGFQVNIETSGTHPLTGQLDWITFSPKKFKAPLEEIFEVADELKIVVFHSSDLKWAVELSERVNDACELYLQVEWSKRDKMTPLMVDFVKENPQWKISVQTHKYMDIP